MLVMNIKLLVDAIVQQTTVLIAQLSTNAGVRAPLAHIADQVFLSLSREIEAQGVKRKVVADMFGMALRGYQKRTQRAAASASAQGKTLFEAILEFVETSGGCNREVLLHRFRNDNDREVAGVLNDLVESGLLYTTGSGLGTLYGVTSEAERQQFTRRSDTQALASMALGVIYRTPGITATELCATLMVEPSEVKLALQVLLQERRIEETGEGFHAPTFIITSDATHGWEAAVFDHFQAVCTAMATKVQLRHSKGPLSHLVGGTTLHFELSAEHPSLPKVLALFEQIRTLTDTVWDEVYHHNEHHVLPDDKRVNLTLYFGQNVDDLARLQAGEF
jgi:hypothetical protein